ncbi:MAG: TIGR03960 family B12-binding radical SAM protein [Cyanobacteria bacterium RI_101]|nr:TIGR03960 family B12-binding radical SAM protein [Cyanobacteria bacterium RI_101]
MPVAPERLITPQVHKPARYLGNEHGAVHKDWESAAVRWALTYPEVYEVGSSNLGHIILYSIVNAQPRQLCDRAYLPGADLGARLRETETPLFALESKRFLLDFDILGFSLSYELGATNILEMLSLAQIPLTWARRREGNYPLIFAGGQTATSNPEPYADFFDFFALGDGEELLPEIGLVLEEGKAAGLSREELLLDLAQIPGVYAPCFYDATEDGSVLPNRPEVPPRILRRAATPIPHYSIGLTPYVETVHDRLTVEIRRGCTRGCRFCQPGMLTRPARDAAPEAVIETIERGIRETGYNEFSLLSLSCSDYLALPAVGIEIRNRLQRENISLSLPSQRVDRFDENIAHILGGNRQGSLTFAPEAGTQRLRDVINKGLTNEELLRGIKTAAEQGWDKIKLYFMIGLPGETDVDVLGIAETVRWLRSECRLPKRKPLSFNLTISNFTPKPHTPFQWHSVSTAEFIRKQNLLREAFRDLRNVKVNYTDVRISAMEDFVGRGDRRLGRVIQRAWELGAGMDAWWDNLDRAFGAWEEAINESGLTGQYRNIEQGNLFQGENLYQGPLPWDHLDTGISKQWLLEDLQKALEAATVPDCSFEGCSHCGVCGAEFGHNVIVPPLPIPVFQGDFQPPQNRVQRLRIWFGKQGDMALVSHLDLVRLFDRLVRRAALPIAFTGGFHPGPRIAIASALPLGFTSSGEIADFELTERLELEDFQRRLAEALPPDLPLYRVEEVPVNAPSGAQQITTATYRLTLESETAYSLAQWQAAAAEILAQTEIPWTRTTKSGKTVDFNLREQLLSLILDPETPDPAAQITLHYQGSCRNDGAQLRPAQVLTLLERALNTEGTLHLGAAHRQALGLEAF